MKIRPFGSTRHILSNLSYVLRGLGLELVNTLVRPWRAPEYSKPAIQKVFWPALSRCIIHLLPVFVSLFLIWLNNYSYYLGPGLSMNNTYDDVYLALAQIFSKIMEMLCTASLTVVVMQVLRHYLLQDEGIPLGLLGAGLSFSQVSYLWSPEFCLGIKSCLFNRRKWPLFPLLLVTGVVVATIGPSMAVLILPRIQDIPTGITSYYINATADQMWPTNITPSLEYSACSLPNATDYAVCPSGGYSSILSTFATFTYSGFLGGTSSLQPKFQALGMTQGINLKFFSFAVQSGAGLLPVMVNSGQLQAGIMGLGTLAFQPPAIVSVQQQGILIDWFNDTESLASPHKLDSVSEYRYGGLLTSRVRTNFPLVRTKCANAGQNLSEDAVTAEFPVLIYNSSLSDHTHFRWSGALKNVSITDLDRNYTGNIRAQWTELPREVFGPVSTGLLFEMPWLSGDNSTSSRVAVGCTIQAAWQNGVTTTTSETSYFAWFIENWQAISPSDNDTLLELDLSWLKLLTPIAAESAPLNTVESIINATGLSNFFIDCSSPWGTILNSSGICVPNPSTEQKMTQFEQWSLDCNPAKLSLLENILATVVSDGLSRFNSILTFQPSAHLKDWGLIRPAASDDSWDTLPRGGAAFLPPDDPSKVFQLRTSFTLNGYAYYASSPTDYLAQVVVGVYALIAVIHVFWVLIVTRVSSGAWDTVLELVALCQNSPPTDALRGTSAGIARMSTYKKLVRLRAVATSDESADERVALLFEDDSHGDLFVDSMEHPYNEEHHEEADVGLGAIKLSAHDHGTARSASVRRPLARPSQPSYSNDSEFSVKNAASSRTPSQTKVQTWPLMKNQMADTVGSIVSESSNTISVERVGIASSKIQVGKKYN